MILNIFFIGYLKIEHSIWDIRIFFPPNYKSSLIFFSKAKENAKLTVSNVFVK